MGRGGLRRGVSWERQSRALPITPFWGTVSALSIASGSYGYVLWATMIYLGAALFVIRD